MTNRIVADQQEITIGLGKAGQVVVGLNRLTDSTYQWIFEYGLRQVLNDAHASEKEPEAKLALVAKRLEKLYSGNLARSAPQSRDPVAAEAKRLAKLVIKAWGEAKVAAAKAKYKVNDEEFFAKVVASQLEKARANVEATKLDLGEIEL